MLIFSSDFMAGLVEHPPIKAKRFERSVTDVKSTNTKDLWDCGRLTLIRLLLGKRLNVCQSASKSRQCRHAL